MSSCALCWVQEVNQLFLQFFWVMSGIIFAFVTKKWQYKQFFLSQQHLSILEKKTLFLKCGLCETEKLLFFENSLNFFDAFRCVGHRNVLFSSLIIKKPKPKNVASLWVFVPTGHYFFPKKEVVAFDNSLVRFFFLPSCEEY